MALGSIIYQTIGYTELDNASQRKGFPIKRKYKQTINTQTPTFPASYTEVTPAKMYWMPFLSVPSTDASYVEYNIGDEYGWSDDSAKRAPEIPFSNPRTTKYDDFPTNHKIVYGGDIYIATRYTFEWSDTKFDISINPYKLSNIRKWRKFTDTAEVWTQYWYHPLLKKFYVLADIDKLTELPDFDEPSQSKWDSFTGDAKDMNLNNFTFAQIKELVATGSALSTAQAIVNSVNQQTATPAVAAAAVQTTATFTVSTKATGQTGESTTTKSNSPQMIQRKATGTAGEKTTIDSFSFNLRPNNVSYSNIGVVWTEIDRVNNFPLVDYKNNKLMKISFEFVVEAHSGSISSIYESCEDKLKIIQRMANRPELVVFSDFDSLFTDAGILNPSSGSYREWAIVEMSINSIQRTPSGTDSTIGEISRATVNMTVQEVRLTKDQAIFMPKLNKVPKSPTIPSTTNEPELCIEKATDAQTAVKVTNSKCWYQNKIGGSGNFSNKVIPLG